MTNDDLPDQEGWDKPWASALRLMEEMPPVLTRDAREMTRCEGQARSLHYRFWTNGDLAQMRVSNLLSGASVEHQLVVYHDFADSPWSFVHDLSTRLRTFHLKTIDASDIKTRIARVRKSTPLVYFRHAPPISELHRAALILIGLAADMPNTHWRLALSHPFLIWGGPNLDKVIWRGPLLPEPLDSLVPTMRAYPDHRGYLEYLTPLQLELRDVPTNPVELMKELTALHPLGDDVSENLERFGKRLRRRRRQ